MFYSLFLYFGIGVTFILVISKIVSYSNKRDPKIIVQSKMNMYTPFLSSVSYSSLKKYPFVVFWMF